VKSLRKIGGALDSGDDKGVIIAVALALIVISAVVVTCYFAVPHTPEGYTDIYVLDAQGRAANYANILVVDQNTTFNVFVVNHMGQTIPFEVQLKITNEPLPQLPAQIPTLNTYVKTLGDGEKWEIPASVTVHETGAHSIIFELWHDDAGTLKFTGNAVVRNVDAVSQP
jgi:uncharacterized membrane protein